MPDLKLTTERQHPLGQLSLMRFRIFVREPAAVFGPTASRCSSRWCWEPRSAIARPTRWTWLW